MADARSQSLDDRSPLATARGADQWATQKTLQDFAGIGFLSVST